jgi:hypothetical protein
MLGPPKPRRLDEPIAVSLQDLLPQHNFYRHLEATLDLSFVRDWTHVGLGRDSSRLPRPPRGRQSKRRIILTALVTPADVMESQAMQDLLWRVCFRRKIWPHHVTGDAKYGTTENIVAIEDAGIRAYVPLTDFAHRTTFYGHGQDDFVFDPEHDEYRCPEGHPPRRYSTKHTEGVVAYRG